MHPTRIPERGLRRCGRSSKDSASTKISELLDSANKASDKVSILHLGFIALCSYLLIVVFSTTDTDLLVGKGIKLPGAGVDVPIIFFYGFAPYIVVAFHLNLLLQSYFLSRRLYGCKESAGSGVSAEHLWLRLHVFPLNYYLVGPRTKSSIRWLISSAVALTFLWLPIVTLLVLQSRFLAYQSEKITWLQRVATWIGVILVLRIWPCIVSPDGAWRAYMVGLVQGGWSVWRWTLFWATLGASSVVLIFSIHAVTADLALLALLLLVSGALSCKVFAGIRRLVARSGVSSQLNPARGSDSTASVPGAGALIMIASLGMTLPLGLLINGETWETTLLTEVHPLTADLSQLASVPYRYMYPDNAFNAIQEAWKQADESNKRGREPEWVRTNRLDYRPALLSPILPHMHQPMPDEQATVMSRLLPYRRLTLDDQVLVAQFVQPEIVAKLKSREREIASDATKYVRPLDLNGRNLRGASLRNAVLPGADLRGADLRRADLRGAFLQDANLEYANLSRANLSDAKLWKARMNGTDLRDAALESARLDGAELREADLRAAYLPRATLNEVVLDGARLNGAQLQFAEMFGSSLQRAVLDGADLSAAVMYGSVFDQTSFLATKFPNAELYGVAARYSKFHAANFDGAHIYAIDVSGSAFDGATLVGVRYYDLTLGNAPAELWRNYGILSQMRRDERTGKFISEIPEAAFVAVDLRGAAWGPLDRTKYEALLKEATTRIDGNRRRENLAKQVERATLPGLQPPHVTSCLLDEEGLLAKQVQCKAYKSGGGVVEFLSDIQPFLEQMACYAPEVARAILTHNPDRTRRTDDNATYLMTYTPFQAKPSRLSAVRADELQKDNRCSGLYGLSESEKAVVADWAARERSAK